MKLPLPDWRTRRRFILSAVIFSSSFSFAQDEPDLRKLTEDAVIPESWQAAAKEYSNDHKIHGAVPEYEQDLVARIRRRILARGQDDPFQDQTVFDLRGNVPFELVAIQGGTYFMGSPPEEEDRREDEGPRREVTVSDFWMGKYEVTWVQFQRFWSDSWKLNPRNKNGTPMFPKGQKTLADWVSAPTTPYTPPEQGMGSDPDYPVVNMTQHTANKFCQWLSAETGCFFRLPTEAEWEYACRAGTTGAFSCSEERLNEYAVYDPGQVRIAYEKVGTKKPNPWGLYDMHGNVLEWCLDAYSEKGYEELMPRDPWRRPTERYPGVVRGGSWYDPAQELRTASRSPSSRDWIVQDPQNPQSLWYLSDAIWLGFRVVRPRVVPSEEDMFTVWNCGAYYEKSARSVLEKQ